MPVSRIKIHPEGPEFSRIAQGLWRITEWDMPLVELKRFINSCLELGLTTFDQADIYGDYQAETVFGQVLRDQPQWREKMEIVTKCGIKLVSNNRPGHQIKSYDTSADHIRQSVDRSLQNMNTDYIDLLLIHRPDPFMDPDDTARGLSDVVASGKVRCVGVSNFLPHQYELLASRLDIPLVTNQIEFSVFQLDPLLDGTVVHSQKRGFSPMAWSPFGGGQVFTGGGQKGVSLRPTLTRIGQELGDYNLGQVALAWILAHPVKFVPILGSGQINRIHTFIQAEKIDLPREVWFGIYQAALGREVP